MQATGVRPLVQEDLTCHGAAKPMCHNYRACAPKPGSHSYLTLSTLEPVLCNKGSHAMRSLHPTATGGSPAYNKGATQTKVNKITHTHTHIHYIYKRKEGRKKMATMLGN